MAPPFKFGKEAATAMAHMACLDDESSALPQGGVLSPYIANMICRRMDRRLAQLAKDNRCRYTRYADDMTFSTNDKRNLNAKVFLDKTYDIIESENFSVNRNKEKILTPKDRQIVTGIVVNEGMNVNRKYIRNLRATIYNCEKKGIAEQTQKKKEFKNKNNSQVKSRNESSPTEEDFLSHLLGKLRFVGDVVLSNAIDKSKNNEKEYTIKDNIDIEKYSRVKTHALLVTRLYQLVIKKGGKYSKIEESLLSLGKKNPLLKNMKVIVHRNKSVREISEEVKKKHDGNYPQRPDMKKTNTVLQSFKKSDGLGIFTHYNYDKDLTFERGIEILLDKYYQLKYYLPRDLQSLIEEYIEKYERFSVSDINPGKFDPYCEKMLEATQKLKFNTRYDKTENSIEFVIDEIFNRRLLKDKIRSDFNIQFNIAFDQIYTFVPKINECLERILDSMFKNSKSKNLFIETSLNTTSNIIELLIRDDARLENSFPLGGNGKIDGVIKNTAGLCDYLIEALDENGNRVCFDMREGRTSTLAPLKPEGFVHRLRFLSDNLNDYDEENVNGINDKSKIIGLRANYKVLLVDISAEERPQLSGNLKKIDFIELTSIKKLIPTTFKNKDFDLIFFHTNNPDNEKKCLTDYVAKHRSVVVVEFSGNFQNKNKIHKRDDGIYIASETFMRSKPKVEKLLRKLLLKENNA